MSDMNVVCISGEVLHEPDYDRVESCLRFWVMNEKWVFGVRGGDGGFVRNRLSGILRAGMKVGVEGRLDSLSGFGEERVKVVVVSRGLEILKYGDRREGSDEI